MAIGELYLDPFKIGAIELAINLQISQSIVSRIINGKGGITPLMALKLSKVLGRSPESWLLMQDQHDLWSARQNVDLGAYQMLKFA
ncbi:MAG TPA: addiction module antidote protein, HigA family [Oceanospirillaceae bacterium]|nr:addiction module antidote protein, HigA family [Oceanospirillaceae bacterium]